MNEEKPKRTYQKRSAREKESVRGIIALVKRVEELEEENSDLRNALEEERQKSEERYNEITELENELAQSQVSILTLKSTQNIPATLEGIVYELIRTRLAYWDRVAETEKIDLKDRIEIEIRPLREIFSENV